MNCFDLNNFCSPVIKAWSNEDMIYDQDDCASDLSFLRGAEDFEETKFGHMPASDETYDFGLNWLIEEDRNQLYGCKQLKAKNRAASFHITAKDTKLSSQFSQTCEQTEPSPKLAKNLTKPERASKTKTQSVRSTKTRIT